MAIVDLIGAEAYERSPWDHSDLDFENTDFFWMGIRGTNFRPQYVLEQQALARHRGKRELKAHAHLVAEPDNPHDPLAVAVYSDARQHIGYVGAHIARNLHWHVRRIEQTGSAAFTRILLKFNEEPPHDDYDYDDYEDLDLPEAWIALPTFRRLERLGHWDEAERQLFRIWTEMPREVRHSLVGTFLDQNTELMKYLRSVRTSAPLAAIPDSDDPGALPPQLRSFFLDRRPEIRSEKVQEKSEKRLLELQAKQRKKEAKEREKRVLSDAIAEMLLAGASRSRIESELGTSAYTISRVAKERGLTNSLGAPGMNIASLRAAEGRVKRCLQAAAMADEGLIYSEISSALGIGPSTVKDLVADGRFYQNPNRNASRLRQAVTAHNDPETLSALSKKQLQRTKADIRVLRDRHPHLLKGEP